MGPMGPWAHGAHGPIQGPPGPVYKLLVPVSWRLRREHLLRNGTQILGAHIYQFWACIHQIWACIHQCHTFGKSVHVARGAWRPPPRRVAAALGLDLVDWWIELDWILGRPEAELLVGLGAGAPPGS